MSTDLVRFILRVRIQHMEISQRLPAIKPSKHIHRSGPTATRGMVVRMLHLLVAELLRHIPGHRFGVQDRRSERAHVVNQVFALAAAFAPAAKDKQLSIAEQRGRVTISTSWHLSGETWPGPDHRVNIQLSDVIVVLGDTAVLETAATEDQQPTVRGECE